MGLFTKQNKGNNANSKNDGFLKINVTKEGDEYTFFLEGRLSSITSPELDHEINKVIDNAKKLTFDLSELEYISSAGLRVLLGALQNMEDKGETVVRNLTPAVYDIFELTGFKNLFNIK